MTTINSTPGLDLNALFNQGMEAINNKGQALQAKMDEITASGAELSPEQMLALQMEMGQYNTLMESISTVTKSLTDSMKSIAQRAG